MPAYNFRNAINNSHQDKFVLNIGILIFNDIELLDFAGPFEVFSVTNALNKYDLCNTFTVAEKRLEIKTVNGLKVNPDFDIMNCPKIDILIIPGGTGTRNLLENDTILNWIKNSYEISQFTFTVCSGSRLLGKIGLINNIKYTTHHEVFEDMIKIAPKALLIKNERFIDSGKILSSAGISAGIDLSLYMVEKLFGNKIMEQTKTYMEYGNWKNLIK
ncbi:DJ-1/PfpI family protein [Leptospira sp. GIMC2001]|uniref:DJ-1/PfpI family protein n=1 Tax=Leptospira sp. GIMC2001 TaxID=1513297 RepID=UPI00234AC5BE|nr:DJ-1/PfpI family protein [Leptospira sp. GIMC2001]WCL50634.1 DJ-1/PfpI family protein [Leptospira sp. GIMC2001]